MVFSYNMLVGNAKINYTYLTVVVKQETALTAFPFVDYLNYLSSYTFNIFNLSVLD